MIVHILNEKVVMVTSNVFTYVKNIVKRVIMSGYTPIQT